MCAAMRVGEDTPATAGPTSHGRDRAGGPVAVPARGGDPVVPVASCRVTATLVATPTGGRWHTRCSTDAIELTRVAGRVTGSRRLPPSAAAPLTAEREREVDAALRLLDRRLPVISSRRLQSVYVTAAGQLRILARLESRFGPVVVGGIGSSAVMDLLAWLQAWPEPVDGPPDPGTGGPGVGRPEDEGWRGRPLVFGPAVAAAVLVGVRLALASRAGSRLDGRQVLPPVTLLDAPVGPTEGGTDDAGRPAGSWELVRRGRVVLPPRDPATGLQEGRAVWSHDRGRLATAGWFGLTLSGPAPQRLPSGAVELLQCVEGVRRFHPDGRMSLLCVAREGSSRPPFLVGLTGRPLTLLRAVTALAGESRASFSDHQVVTPALVLPPARSLERSPDVRISAL
jgi:hypothetical protein